VHVLERGAAAHGLLRHWPQGFEHGQAGGVAYHTARRAASDLTPGLSAARGF
jgi:hypothetical protein